MPTRSLSVRGRDAVAAAIWLTRREGHASCNGSSPAGYRPCAPPLGSLPRPRGCPCRSPPRAAPSASSRLPSSRARLGEARLDRDVVVLLARDLELFELAREPGPRVRWRAFEQPRSPRDLLH